MARAILLALIALLFHAAPAWAGPDLGVTLEGRVGYGTNPFLSDNSLNGGSALVGVTIAPQVTWRGQRSTTQLTGSYNRDQYFTRYGDTDDFSVDLRRTQRLSSKLKVNAHTGYLSSISGLLSPYYNNVVTTPGSVDQLAVGVRQQRISGDAGLNWTPNERDSYDLSVAAEHDSYSGSFGSSYYYYGVTGGYTRVIDQRTTIGVNTTISKIVASQFPGNTSVSPNVTLSRVLSARWTFNGSVGAIIERQRLVGRTHTTISPGFSGSLCGNYTRLSGCVTASRQIAPSGLGGLRQQTQVALNISYSFSSRTRLLAVGSFGLSKSSDELAGTGIFSNQRYSLARVTLQRDLKPQLSAGVSASYQSRTGRGLPEGRALAITFNLTAKIGRVT